MGSKPAGREGEGRGTLTSAQRLLLLDTWQRSGLPAEAFAGMVGLSKHTLYLWKKRFEQLGPAGLTDQPRGAPKGSRLSEATRRAIVMLKQAHSEWGCERIAEVLWRSEGYEASAGAVSRVLKEEGYEAEEAPSVSHEPVQRRFERARPNQLWQSDLFTFLLKRENRRVYLVVFLDDHSRFVVGFGVHATPSGALVREVLEAGLANYGPPEEVLTDNGPQYQTWRGKSAFSRLLEKRGIRHLVSRPRHPQTLGKVERFWGTLWRECLEAAVFQDLSDARTRVGLFIDYYNFLRPHQGLEGLVPADRYFEAAEEVRRTLQARVAENALDLARHGVPRKSFYLTGKVGEQAIALHAEGERVILTTGDGRREEVDLKASGRRAGPGVEPGLPEPVTPQGGTMEEPAGGEP
ncbi:MAG TPA: IS481 family transposase [Candidatus Polarisedimenticolia bacterium]|nr:IS481 family transposase [Candidatus Polarisedimenticolia bacterium]